LFADSIRKSYLQRNWLVVDDSAIIFALRRFRAALER
jgi:hypothetical protein